MDGLTVHGDPRESRVLDQAAGQAPLGRERECGLLDALLGALPERGAALLLRGDPGTGKSTMLDHVARRSRARVLRAGGVESEAVLPYTVLADLLLPLRHFFADLPDTQRMALETCFALADHGEPNPYAVCVGALGVVAAAGDAEPLVVLVDDMHWADPSSRRVLQFVARRLTSERAILVMAVRAERDDFSWEGIPQVTLAPLGEDACRELLQRVGVDPAGAAGSHLIRLSMGNPLVLVEYAAAATRAPADGPGAWHTAGENPGPLVDRAWWGQMRDLSVGTLAAMVYVAACRSPELPLLERALAADGLSLGDLDEAEEAGLVRIQAGRCELRHPVLRPLVLRRCSTARRLRAFHTLADVSSGDLRTWYRASAATGPDEEVAAALADEAERYRRRGALGSSAPTWHRSAELSPGAPEKAARLLNAARDAFYGGASRDAVAWCDQALRWGEDPRLTADVELLRGQAHAWLGDPARAHRSLVAAARAVEPVDRARACALYGAATMPAVMDGRFAAALDISARCAALADLIGPRPPSADAVNPQLHLANVMRGNALTLTGRVREGRQLLLAGHRALHGDWSLDEGQLAVQIAQGLSWVDAADAAGELLSAVIDRARRAGAPALLPYALVGRCELASWNRWPTARADGTEALRWALETGHLAMTGYALTLLARLDGLRGDRAGCADRIAEYERYCGDNVRGLELFAEAALGSAALSAGDPQEARGHLDRAWWLAQDMGLGNPNLLPFLSDLAEAHLRTGDRERAAELADWLARQSKSTGLAWPMAAHAQCHILLAESADDACEWLAAAEQAHARREMPFELARSRLACGQLLRRLRRPAAARELLLAAQLAFTSLGAAPWRARAAAELSAAGHRGAPSAAQEQQIDRLTAQELQVALAIGDGMTNGEAATALFLSRKTVEAHLTRAYRKLGVRSRTELTRYLAHAEGVR